MLGTDAPGTPKSIPQLTQHAHTYHLLLLWGTWSAPHCDRHGNTLGKVRWPAQGAQPVQAELGFELHLQSRGHFVPLWLLPFKSRLCLSNLTRSREDGKPLLRGLPEEWQRGTANRAAGLATVVMLLLTCPPQPPCCWRKRRASGWSQWGEGQGVCKCPGPPLSWDPYYTWRAVPVRSRVTKVPSTNLNCNLKKMAGECKNQLPVWVQPRFHSACQEPSSGRPSQTAHDKNSSSSVETLGIPTLNSNGTPLCGRTQQLGDSNPSGLTSWNASNVWQWIPCPCQQPSQWLHSARY